MLFIGFNVNAQTQSVSVGYGWNNLPWQLTGFGVNTDYVISINDKWVFKPNAGYKTSQQQKENNLILSKAHSIAFNASFGLTIAKKGKYKLIPYLGPSFRYTSIESELKNKDSDILSFHRGSHYEMYLNSEHPKDELNLNRFGYSIHLENQFQLGSKYVSFVPYLEPDISFDPNFGGFYISYYFR